MNFQLKVHHLDHTEQLLKTVLLLSSLYHFDMVFVSHSYFDA